LETKLETCDRPTLSHLIPFLGRRVSTNICLILCDGSFGEAVCYIVATFETDYRHHLRHQKIGNCLKNTCDKTCNTIVTSCLLCAENESVLTYSLTNLLTPTDLD